MSILSRIGKGSLVEKERKNEILIMRGLIYNLSMNIINNYRCSSTIDCCCGCELLLQTTSSHN